eukprot:TRINITY_DN27275_c0_g2_i1.p1 TRINITY_DN27275_c0_g2~~TRINITY_DN27275_c0_g2_i1.p1  ORF type:complete len:157 (-),score=14.59 TRINITY_DN27275_c0_g2_i1:100-570(-)
MFHEQGYAVAADTVSSAAGCQHVAACGPTFCIFVHSLSGDGFQVEVTGSMRGCELMRMIGHHQPSDEPGLYTPLLGGSLIDPSRTLQEQGLSDGDDATLMFEAATAEDLKVISDKYEGGLAHAMTDRELLIFDSLRDFAFAGEYTADFNTLCHCMN